MGGPVRTVTSYEIVPGSYGEDNHLIHVSPAGTSTMVHISTSQRMSKNHLRAAARMFNELADALETAVKLGE